jgi:hypothetical protein
MKTHTTPSSEKNTMNMPLNIDALRDALLIRAGLIANPHSAHPAAEALSGGNVLGELAKACGLPLVQGRDIAPNAILGKGIATTDFKNTLAGTLRSVTTYKWDSLSKHRALCSTQELADFKDRTFPSFDVDFPLQEVAELSEYGFNLTLKDGAGLESRVKSFGTNFNISRETILADDIELMSAVFANAGASAARLEAEAVYSLLESNPVLGDGELMFHADHGNTEAGALDATSMGSAMGKLRTMRTPAGAASNLDAAFLVVSPELEYRARALLADANILTIQVVAGAWIATGHWYLMASPNVAPVIARLRLKRDPTGVSVEPRRTKPEYDGIGLGVRVYFGVTPVGRVGAVRGGV